MSLVSSIKDNDWSSVRQAIQKIASIKLGPNAIPIFAGLTLSGLTASRLLSTNAAKEFTSVADLTSWIAGTTNQITVTDDADGTVTLSLPQNIHTGASPTFVGLTLSSIAAESSDVDKFLVDSSGVIKYRTGVQTLSDIGGQTQGNVLDDLNTLGAAASDGQFIVATAAGAFAYESGATARNSLGLGSIATFAGDQNLAIANSPTFVTGTFTDIVVNTNLIKTVSATNCVGINIVGTPTHALEILGEVKIVGTSLTGEDAPTAFEAIGGLGDDTQTGGPVGLWGGPGGSGTVGEPGGTGGAVILAGGAGGCDGGEGVGVAGVVRFDSDASLNSSDFLVPLGSRILITAPTASDVAIGGIGLSTLTFTGTNVANSLFVDFFTAATDNSKSCIFQIFGLGNIDQLTNTESLFFGWSATPEKYIFATNKIGTGTAKPLDIYTYGNTGQVYLTTDNKVGIGLTSPKTKLTIEGALTLKEQAAADGDTAAYGQIWVKTAAPNELWFTDDVGTDLRIAPQDLQTSASPTFAGLTLSGNLTMPDGGTIGQAAGPLLTFDDTNDNLALTGGYLSITPPSGYALRIDAVEAIEVTNPTSGYGFSLSAQPAGGLILVRDDSGNAVFEMDGRYSHLAIREIVSGPGGTATYGKIWVKNDAPNILMFTDDAGTHFTIDVTAV